MAASLLCTENVAEARMIDEAFVDVRAWIESTVEPPKWPFGAIDTELAATGERVFNATCAKCHGTYGADAIYPNQLVPLADVGTDDALVQGETQFGERFTQWFAASFWGETSRLEPHLGYVAPPLDGIWATAPYLHNGSVPTLRALLDSSRRAKFFTRSYDSNDYDREAVGWRIIELAGGQLDPPAGVRASAIYDTTVVGYGNGGHLYGDSLRPDERDALIEYLKTL
jgi:hypothetical protein